MWFNRHILTPVSFQSGNWPHLPSLLCKIVHQLTIKFVSPSSQPIQLVSLPVCQFVSLPVCQFVSLPVCKFASQFSATMLFSIVLLIILAYAIKHWEVSMKMSVNDWRLELFRQRQKQTKTDKDKDRNRQIQRQTKSKTKTKAKTGQNKQATPGPKQTYNSKNQRQNWVPTIQMASIQLSVTLSPSHKCLECYPKSS